jgi:uncharacterized protein YbaP (TraB family)
VSARARAGAARLLLALLALLAVPSILAACRKSSSGAAGIDAAAPSGASAAAPVPADSDPSGPRPTEGSPDARGARAGAWSPLLWRIDGDKPSFLLGTIHVPDDRLEPLAPSVERALAAADAVLTEIPMDPATQLRMTPMLMLPKGRTLATVLPKDVHERVERLFESKGLPLAPFEPLKVWAVAVQITVLDKLLVFATKKPLDVVLYARAQAAGKQVGGLETPEEQVAAIEVLTEKEQVHMLRETLDLLDKHRARGSDPVEALMAPFVAGDDKALLGAMFESYDPKSPVDVKLMKKLFWDRNAVMADRIAAELARSRGSAALFAVGAGHVVGDEGIVARLAKRGLGVRRVAREEAAPAPW